MEHIVVLGGGVIGLSCAFECKRRGYEVTLLEANHCGGQASGAAAGMLAPYSENGEGPDDFFQLCLHSLQLYANWQADIKQSSGMSFEFVNSGSLYVAYHEADVLALEERLKWQKDFGSSGELLLGEKLYSMEPLISKEVVAAIYYPEESHVYAPDYVAALVQACRNEGVNILDQLGDVTLTEWQQRIELKSAVGDRFYGDRLVICSGAWTQRFEQDLALQLPIYPIRGQICAYEMSKIAIHHMVFSNQGYLVSKGNGTIVCGASEDIAGFDTTVTDKGISRLLKWNKRLFPFLAYEQPFHSWAGLRPATQDGFPLLGKLSRAAHIIVAAGHYRNGILLSPVTGKVVADLIDGTMNEQAIAAFSPNRFTERFTLR